MMRPKWWKQERIVASLKPSFLYHAIFGAFWFQCIFLLKQHHVTFFNPKIKTSKSYLLYINVPILLYLPWQAKFADECWNYYYFSQIFNSNNNVILIANTVLWMYGMWDRIIAFCLNEKETFSQAVTIKLNTHDYNYAVMTLNVFRQNTFLLLQEMSMLLKWGIKTGTGRSYDNIFASQMIPGSTSLHKESAYLQYVSLRTNPNHVRSKTVIRSAETDLKLEADRRFLLFSYEKLSHPVWFFFPRGGSLWGLLTAGRGGVCVRVCTKVEVTPLLTFFAPKGHTLFRRMQNPRLMDDRSGCFPGFIHTREIVIHPLGEAEGGAGPLFCSALIFSSIQDTMKRLRAQLPWQGFKGRWSKSWDAAVLSVNSTELCWAEDWRLYMVQPKIQFVFLLWCFITVYTPLMHSCTFTHIVCHQRMWWQDDAPVTQCLVWMWLSLNEKTPSIFYISCD